jgi:HK97 family phage portal protein
MKDEINGKGQPSAVYPLLPQFIEIIPDREKRIKGYLYRVNGRVIELEPEEMIHFRNPHPNNVIFGIGDLEAGEMMFEDYINRNSLESHYLSKGGVPSGVLVRKEEVEDSDEWTKFTRKWKDEYEGIENSGKTAFLNGDWNYVKLGLSPVELQTMQRSQDTVKNIYTLHGVPLSVAGVEKAANYATARQDTIHFKRWTIMPMLDMLCGKLNANKTLCRAYDPALRLSYELGGMADVGGIISEYGPLIDKGAMTRNELRVMCELEEVKDKPMMDEFLITQGLVPIDMAGMGGGEVPDDTINGVVNGDPGNTNPDDEEEDDDEPKPKPPKRQPDSGDGEGTDDNRRPKTKPVQPKG